jgi:hypothetical protein
LQGCLSVERMCHLAQVSRSGFYRYLQVGASVRSNSPFRHDSLYELHKLRVAIHASRFERQSESKRSNHTSAKKEWRSHRAILDVLSASLKLGLKAQLTVCPSIAKNVQKSRIFMRGCFEQGSMLTCTSNYS